ncbi:ABC transporter ATP-binding protein [Anaerococcus lactolyticus]|uniref:ABC transporter ATP-binding protein n=1 Tax=Anaerococcus lactolyticus TaxID=33032 RepID=UPI0023F27191|nr:ABC transporter ATP-binding protein [Anaerococcus lactolyticus]
MKNKLKALWIFIKITAKNDPLYILVIILNALAPAAATMINVFVPMIFINQITDPRPANDFIKIVLLLIIGKILLESLERLLNREEFVRRQGINDYLTFELAKKAMDLTYQNIENPHTLDLKEKANAAINMGAIHNLLSCLKDIITSVATMIGTALVIISFSPYLVGFSILISFLIILVNGKQSAYTSKFDLEIVNVNRRFSYYFSLMASPHYQKEIRVFDLGEMLQSKTQEYLDQMMDGFEDKYGFEANMGAIKIFLESILRLVSYTYVAMRTLSAAYGPQISFGSFSAIIGANENFMTSFQTMFSELADFIMSLANLEPLYDFYILDSDFEENLEKASDFQSLEFKNVTFAYPGSERKIIDNLSFRINKGEKISIVGVNNAGKTTIVKILLRFFDIDSGEILYNGVNIKNISKKSLYEKITGVFQDFAIMPFTIKENIIGDKEFRKNKTDEIIKQLDLDKKIKELANGINTYLNKDIYENATDLSLGQKQKLAIARALYQNADFLILDEPTASLDPLAESKIYEHFNEMTEGKTAIFISHRMSSSRFTDKILLLDGGKAAAFDSHENLMKSDNLYSKLYKAQAQYFE